MARTDTAAIPLKALEPQTPVRPLGFLKSGFITLTPAQMIAVRDHAQYPRQRRVDPRHVAALAEIMRRGQWSPRDKIDFARLGDRLILINGYHRTEAQIAAGMPIEWTVVIHDCAAMAEVDALYHRFDTNIRARTNQAILNSADLAGRTGLNKVTTECLYRAVPFLLNGFRVGKDVNSYLANNLIDDRLRVAEDYAPEAAMIAGWMARAGQHMRNRLRGGGVWAVMLETTRQRPAVAEEFWPRVFDLDGLPRNDPRATLARFFIDGTSGRDVTIQMIACALAWNAHFRREERAFLRVGSIRSVALLGTTIEIAR